jgi:hypothetical protein
VLILCGTGKCYYRRSPTISVLPDDVLLEIFDFCRKNNLYRLVWDWDVLAHVCQRWRKIVFASPHRLDLRILCTERTPVRKNLGVWPSIPIIIGYSRPIDEDDIIAALEHPNRVCSVRLHHVTGPQLGKIVTVMQEPYPALTELILSSEDRNVPILPGEFLGRSAPSLQKVLLTGIPFPALPVLLPSASDLVSLKLFGIPRTGYISPEAMVAGLTTLTRLKDLSILFQSPASRPNRIRLPPTTRTVLPALTSFSFVGAREYLEDFAARIDALQLDSIDIRYFNQLVDFQVPQLSRFINHPESLKRPMHCSVEFRPNRISFIADPTSQIYEYRVIFPCIDVCILCQGIDWQVSHLTQALSQMSAVLSNMVHFAINWLEVPLEGIEDIEWVQLLRLFTSVQTLFVSGKFARYIACVLQDVNGERATEVLPALDLLCLEDHPVSSVDKFIAVRRDSGRPVTIVNTKTEFGVRPHRR